MLGLPDATIAIVYALCVGSALLCVVYGIHHVLAYVLPQIWNGAIAISTGLFFGLCGAAFFPCISTRCTPKRCPRRRPSPA